MNYPSDKNKLKRRKLSYKNKYLIYDIGYGEQGSEERWSIYRYYICEGSNEEQAVKDWIRQSLFEENEVELRDGVYHTERSWLRIIKLVGGSDENDEPKLEWVDNR